MSLLGDLDLHLLGEGRHERLWEVLGAHPSSDGATFAVWAPHAREVRVPGDFNGWDSQALSPAESGGVWTAFVNGAKDGDHYKYQVYGADGHWREKADPMAFRTERPPGNASIVHRPSHHWGDDAWMAHRSEQQPHAEPMSIYEVHLGSWRQGRTYRDLAEELTAYVTTMGFTHVEFLPVAEHPFGGSWGYQVTSYYAPTARYGSPDDFRYLVDMLHQAGIGVIIDWVPAHFPRDDWALARFDGVPLYEHPDPRRGEHPDWGTYIFDYGRPEVRNFLIANALFWLSEYHVDGLRVDAVASMLYLDYSRTDDEWTPNVHGGRENLEAVAFLKEVTATAYRHHPGSVMIAEESTAWSGVTRPTSDGGLGFGMKWNMGWMHDALGYLARDPIYRVHHHNQLTFSMMYAYSENYVLPLSHDEVVHGKGSLLGKMPGDRWQQLATLRAFFAYMWAHPGKQLLFMGGEIGPMSEWAESGELPWDLLGHSDHAGLQRLVADLNRVYRSLPALWSLDFSPSGFSWISADDAAANTVSLLRFGSDGSTLACVTNFSPTPHEQYRLGLPTTGDWDEVVNTDASAYGGSNVGNLGRIHASPDPHDGQPASATIRVPPLGTMWFRQTGN